MISPPAQFQCRYRTGPADTAGPRARRTPDRRGSAQASTGRRGVAAAASAPAPLAAAAARPEQHQHQQLRREDAQEHHQRVDRDVTDRGRGAEGFIDTAKASAGGSVIEPASTPESDRKLNLNTSRAISPTVISGTSVMSTP